MSNFPEIENALRRERPDQDSPAVDPEKTNYAFEIEPDDVRPDYDLASEPDVICIADDEPVTVFDTPDNDVKPI